MSVDLKERAKNYAATLRGASNVGFSEARKGIAQTLEDLVAALTMAEQARSSEPPLVHLGYNGKLHGGERASCALCSAPILND